MSAAIVAFDYEPNHLLLYKSILQPHGYHVVCYGHDRLDFAELDTLQPQLLIWGHVFGFDNRELDIVEEIRRHPSTNDLPVLLISTASKLVVDVHRLAVLSDLYMLYKPFAAEELLTVVKTAIRSSPAQT